MFRSQQGKGVSSRRSQRTRKVSQQVAVVDEDAQKQAVREHLDSLEKDHDFVEAEPSDDEFKLESDEVLVFTSGQNEESVAKTSTDGTQQGSITLSRDGTRGAVSSSSTGRERAFASSSLVIGPGTTEGSFSAEGDTQQVSDTLSLDPEKEEAEPEEPVEKEEAKPEEAIVIEEQAVEEAPEPKQKKSAEQPEAAPEDLEEEETEEFSGEGAKKEQPFTFGESGTRVFFSSSGSNTEDAEKVCLVGDDSEFQKFLDDGYEVTLVQATEDKQIRITTALEWPSVSTKHAITSRYIPAEIKERCDVSYEDLGLEDRSDGEASLSSSGSSFHFSSSGSGAHASTSSGSDIRKRVFANLCNQHFFRNFALIDECKGMNGDIEDEDEYPWG